METEASSLEPNNDSTDDSSNVALTSRADQDAHLDNGQQEQKNHAASSSDVILETNVDEGTHHDNEDGQPSQPTSNNGIAEKLDRELALSNTHRLQLQGHWRQVLCKEKYQELHGELPQLIQYHDQNIARKKDVVNACKKEISDLQELYQDAMVANMNRMEDLIAIHDDQVVKLERTFRDRVSSLQSQFHVDDDQINAQYDKEKELIRQCIQCQAQKEECQTKALRQEHQHELEEIKNRNLEHINSLRFIMDSKVEDLEEQFEQTHGEFAQNTDSTQAAYDQLKSKEGQMRKEIESKTRQANKLQREIQRFQLIAKQEEAQIKERHTELLTRKSRAIARWNMTQEEMTRFRDEQQKRLVLLICRANERKEGLQRQCALAERVTKIALACQKWESSREKFASLLRESSCPMAAVVEKQLPEEEEEEERDSTSPEKQNGDQTRPFIVGCMGQLGDTTHHFWNKYNMAKLDVLMLEKKVRSLNQREQDLKKKLKMYQDGITVNNDVLKDRNPLFVINGRMNAMPNNAHPGKKRVMRRLTVVDGNHFFATKKKAQVA